MKKNSKLKTQNSKPVKLETYGQKPEARSSKGFTLIELLTVIAIIAILTGILTFAYTGVRQRARDAQRKSDIKQIQSALELYRADNNTYPTTANFNSTACGAAFTGGGSTVYMQKLPCDPTNTNQLYFYSQTSGSTYVIASCLENTNDKDATSSQPSGMTACTSGKYYVSSNP